MKWYWYCIICVAIAYLAIGLLAVTFTSSQSDDTQWNLVVLWPYYFFGGRMK